MRDRSVYKRWTCRDTRSQQLKGAGCPLLHRPNRAWNPLHGTWAYRLELPKSADGRRRQLRRAGFIDRESAERERDQARQAIGLAVDDRIARTQVGNLLQRSVTHGLAMPDLDDLAQRLRTGRPIIGVPTVAEWLTAWLGRLRVDPSTARTYESHVRMHLIPYLGDVLLDRLRPHHIDDLVDRIEDRNTAIREACASLDPAVRAGVRGVRPTGAATIARVRATLRKAFNDALRRKIVGGVTNPASLVPVANPRPRPVVWEPERVDRWRTSGRIPSAVMVWTPRLTLQFLDFAAEYAPDLHPLLHLMAYRGPRRGEACGLLDAEVRLEQGEVSIVSQLTVYGGIYLQKEPKSRTGVRDLVLDADTVAVLRAYRARRSAWQLASGSSWPSTGLFFVRCDGRAWNPSSVSQAFRRLVFRAGLPPIRLHDLRHGAATAALAAGVDVKVVSEQLGHSTTTLTRDTYQSVVKRLHHDAANAVAAIMRGDHPITSPPL